MKKLLIDLNTGNVVKEIDVNFSSWREPKFIYGVEFVWKDIDAETRKIALINKNFELLTDFRFDSCNDFHEGLAVVEIDEQFGYIDLNGDIAIPIQYESYNNFENGLAKVQYTETKKFGYIDLSGNLVIGCYDILGDFSDGLVYARNSGSDVFYFLDRKGEIVLTMKYPTANDPDAVALYDFFHEKKTLISDWPAHSQDHVVRTNMANDGFYHHFSLAFCEFHDGLCPYAENTSDGIKFGFYDKSGNIVIPAQFDFASRFYGGISFYSNGNNIYDCKSGILTTSGEKIEIGDFYWDFGFESEPHEELFAIRANKRNGKPNTNGKYGFVDREGNIVIAPQFDSIRSFENGMAGVCIGFKKGFVNYKGEYIIPAEYDHAYRFDKHGLCIVSKFGEYDRLLNGIIDKSGNVIAPLAYEEIEILSKDRFFARTDNGYTLFDISGTPISNQEFGYISKAFDNYVFAEIDLPGKKQKSPTGKTFRKSCYEGRYLYFYDRYSGCADKHGYDFGIMKEDRTILTHQMFEYIGYYSDGLIRTETDFMWVYVDLEGKPVLFDFSDTCSDFIDGAAYIVTHSWGFRTLDSRCTLIIRKGNSLSEVPLIDNKTTFFIDKHGDIIELTLEQQDEFLRKYQELRNRRYVNDHLRNGMERLNGDIPFFMNTDRIE